MNKIFGSFDKIKSLAKKSVAVITISAVSAGAGVVLSKDHNAPSHNSVNTGLLTTTLQKDKDLLMKEKVQSVDETQTQNNDKLKASLDKFLKKDIIK